RELSGKIFEAVYCQIHPAFGQGFFDLLREHALSANLGQRDIENLVPGRLDDFEFDLVPLSAPPSGNGFRLPERKWGAARANAQTSHQSCSPSSGVFTSLFSCRLNKRRTRSMTVVASASRAADFKVLDRK